MSFLPKLELDAAAAERVGHGMAVPGDGPGERRVRLTHDGRVIAIARPDGENLRPEVVLV
jgi:hypothetical protein